MWTWLLGGADFIPHGVCLAWRPDLMVMEATSDVLIALAYYALPVAIWLFLRGRTDLLREHRRLALLFVGFIAACGTTHLFNVITLWIPAYGSQALVKLLTAIISVLAAVIVWPQLPKLIAIPTRTELEAANQALQAEIAAHRQTLKELEETQATLEARVQSQTEDLRRNVADLEHKERRLEQVMRELSHRTKNMLGVVQAIAHHSAKSHGASADFSTRLGARLRSLATAHDIQASSQWTGARLEDVVRRHLDHLLHKDGGGRISFAGEEVMLDANTAQYVGLALHELSTNSTQHGALSAPEGLVEISWSRCSQSGALQVGWRERGGPRPRSTRERGFGRTLLETIVPRSLAGQARLIFSRTGMEWTLSAPMTG